MTLQIVGQFLVSIGLAMALFPGSLGAADVVERMLGEFVTTGAGETLLQVTSHTMTTTNADGSNPVTMNYTLETVSGDGFTLTFRDAGGRETRVNGQFLFYGLAIEGNIFCAGSWSRLAY